MDIAIKIEALHPGFDEILKASGSPGLSLGVLHRGEVVHTAHFGRRDASSPSPPDDDTIYHVASLTKAITVGAVASLVEEGLLDWDAPIRNYLPAFRPRTDELGMKCTLRDLLCNRAGLAVANALWGIQHGEFLMPRHENFRMINSLECVKPFRSSFVYSNWAWSLVQEVVEAVSGKTLGAVMKERITGPLGMTRTSLDWIEQPDDPQFGSNLALPHGVTNDAEPVKLTYSNFSDPTGHAAGSGSKSTIRDLLSMYKTLLRTYNSQKASGLTSTPGSPFKQLEQMFSPYIVPNSAAPFEETAYCLGLYRTNLPGNLSVASMNTLLLGGPKKNVIPKLGSADDSPARGVQVFSHTGTIPGSLASYFLVPATESAVVILTNSLPLMDPTDFVGQAALAVLLGEEPSNKYPLLAQAATMASLVGYDMLKDALEGEKTEIPPSLPAEAYTGEYWNEVGNYVITISVNKRDKEQGLSQRRLHMVPNRALRTHFDLAPFDGDTYAWPVDREEELCEKGMWPFLSPAWHKVHFGLSSAGCHVETLTWHHDPLGSPQVFSKRWRNGRFNSRL